jgi:aryl-alcohol dehydrogenase-like predicted oxidoreductase
MENEYLQIFSNQGLGTTIWSPMASGLLSGKYNNGLPEDSRLAIPGFEWLKDRWLVEDKINKAKKFSELAARLGVTPASLSIAWCIKNPHVTTAILGATKKEQLHDNFTALDTCKLLDAGMMEEIEAMMQTKPRLPEF